MKKLKYYVSLSHLSFSLFTLSKTVPAPISCALFPLKNKLLLSIFNFVVQVIRWYLGYDGQYELPTSLPGPNSKSGGEGKRAQLYSSSPRVCTVILLLGFPRISIQHLCLPHIYSIHEGLLLARWLVCQLRSAKESFLALDPSQIWWVILGYPWFKSAHPQVAICCFPNPKRSTKYCLFYHDGQF